MAALDSLGTPVEVASIGKELKKLWSADQTRTRATLFNFAIVCHGEAAMQASNELLENFVGGHAFRAVLIGIEPGDTDRVEAWINARCYLPKAGAKHVCSEQVSLFVRGNVRRLLPNRSERAAVFRIRRKDFAKHSLRDICRKGRIRDV